MPERAHSQTAVASLPFPHQSAAKQFWGQTWHQLLTTVPIPCRPKGTGSPKTKWAGEQVMSLKNRTMASISSRQQTSPLAHWCTCVCRHTAHTHTPDVTTCCMETVSSRLPGEGATLGATFIPGTVDSGQQHTLVLQECVSSSRNKSLGERPGRKTRNFPGSH